MFLLVLITTITMAACDLPIRFASYNCRGYNSSKCEYIRSLLTSCDFLLMQEHWLAESQLSILNDISVDHLAHAISGFDNHNVLTGRPYGGCSIFWRKNILGNISVVSTNSNRVCALVFTCSSFKLVVINVYMPFEDGENRLDEFCDQLSVINHLLEQNQNCHVVLGGDFNVDFNRSSVHGDILASFCESMNLQSSVDHSNYNVDYTYHFTMSRFSILDHFFVSGAIFDTAINSVYCVHDVDNLSDHEPLLMNLGLCYEQLSGSTKSFSPKPAWYKASTSHIDNYRATLCDLLHNINIPTDALLCKDIHCSVHCHQTALNTFMNDITDACLTAARTTIPHTKDPSASKSIPSWKEQIQPLRDKSIFWHNIWVNCGKPHDGTVAGIMRKTRAAYHYAIRSVKRNHDDAVCDRFAASLLSSNGSRDFWSEVKRIRANKCPISSTVDGHSSADDIANFFANKYADLYSCASYDSDSMNDLKRDISDRFVTSGIDNSCIITASDVCTAVSDLKSGKGDGNKGLSSDFLLHACYDLFVYLSMLLTAALSHGYAPDDLLLSTVIPIPKGKSCNVTDSTNYRGIALSSIIGKILDKIIILRFGDLLSSSDLQFGFKVGRSTNMCTMLLKETISYYINNGNTVYCTMLDVTKAFDRVEYCMLFRLLLDRNLPPVIIRFLLDMYTRHVSSVCWNGSPSSSFLVHNGVKQGGVLSPILFCVYFDDLLVRLAAKKIGCFMGHYFVGALAYADDLVLLAPTPRAMRAMLAVCDAFGVDFNVVFNAKKSKCLIIPPHYDKPRISCGSVKPVFTIGGNVIDFVDHWPHLGHIISVNFDDNDEINSRRFSMIGQINSVLCYFSSIDPLNRFRLLRAYCTSYYGCELWNLWHKSLNQFASSWRRGVRKSWRLPFTTHCNLLPALCGSCAIEDDICCRVLNFISTCLLCDCPVVKFVCNYGVTFGKMFSTIGSNILFCDQKYNCNDIGSVVYNHSRLLNFKKYIHSCYCSSDIAFKAESLMELIMIRQGLLCVPTFNLDNVNSIIESICTD